MIEPTVTAEDLALHALGLLEGEEQTNVVAMLRKSTAAREELARIRGDLALFALAAEQHTPPALTRQRLLKQVARERRTVPVLLPVAEGAMPLAVQTFAADRDSAHGGAKNGTMQRQSDEDVTDPEIIPSQPPYSAKAMQTRTFPTRSQVRAGARSPALPLQRVVTEPKALPMEDSALEPEVDVAEFRDTLPSTEAAPRDSYSPDPRVFRRDSGPLLTSATAHSVTMFEQHFAADSTKRPREPDLPPDPEAYSGRRRQENGEAVERVHDRFSPSSEARRDAFVFSAFREHGVEEAPGGVFGRWIGWAGWTAAAAAAVLAAMALRDDFGMREEMSQQQVTAAAAAASGSRGETVVQTLQSPSSQHFLLSRTDTAPSPGGRVSYLPERGALVFQGSNLETLQPYKTYQLWLIPAGEGRQPVPAGLFKPDGHGFATVIMAQLPKGVIAANFGVTIEDDGGSATPTLPILLVGQPS